MTTSNGATVFAIPISGDTVTYQGDDLVSGGGAFSQTIEEEVSGTSDHTTAAISMTGNGVSSGIALNVAVSLESTRNAYTPTASEPDIGLDVSGAPTAKIHIERSTDGGTTWTGFHTPAAVTGRLARFWIYFNENYTYPGSSDLTHLATETATFNKTSGTQTATGTSGQAYQWRAVLKDITWPTSHNTVTGTIRFSVEQNQP
jgi:hypothetical protein